MSGYSLKCSLEKFSRTSSTSDKRLVVEPAVFNHFIMAARWTLHMA